MKNLKLFDEYRYIPFNSIEKDLHEPFFLSKKRKYLNKKKQDEIDAAEENRRNQRLNQENNYRLQLEDAERQRPLVEKCINMIKNGEILKHQYTIEKLKMFNGEVFFIKLGILLNDKTRIISKYEWFRENIHNFKFMRINGEHISSVKKRRENLSVDPHNEEKWEEDDRSAVNILADLIKEYFNENEMIL